MSIIQASLTPDQQTDITNYINAYRAKHQSPPMTYDPSISMISQQWANNLIINNLFQHSNNSLYGENLASFTGYPQDVIILIKKSIDNWYNEVSLYNFSRPGFSNATGHFTCLVWKSSTSYGIGVTINTTTNTADVVMNTSPAGNVSGQYQINVLPLVTPVPTLSLIHI